MHARSEADVACCTKCPLVPIVCDEIPSRRSLLARLLGSLRITFSSSASCNFLGTKKITGSTASILPNNNNYNTVIRLRNCPFDPHYFQAVGGDWSCALITYGGDYPLKTGTKWLNKTCYWGWKQIKVTSHFYYRVGQGLLPCRCTGHAHSEPDSNAMVNQHL